MNVIILEEEYTKMKKNKSIAWHRKDLKKNWERVLIKNVQDPGLDWYEWRRKKR